MNELTKNFARSYKPVAAIIAYQNEEDYIHKGYYLESRSIDLNGKFGAGKPVSYDFINNIVSSFSEKFSNTPHGVIEKNMLYCDVRTGCEKYIWYNKPQARYFYFSKNLNLENGNYHVPGLIYVVEDDLLSVFAFKSKRLSENSELFRAPFFNTNSSGSVCLGNSKLEKEEFSSYKNIMLYWEKMFWGSEFSNILGSNPTKSNLTTLLKKSKQCFDNNELISCKRKLKDLYK